MPVVRRVAARDDIRGETPCSHTHITNLLALLIKAAGDTNVLLPRHSFAGRSSFADLVKRGRELPKNRSGPKRRLAALKKAQGSPRWAELNGTAIETGLRLRLIRGLKRYLFVPAARARGGRIRLPWLAALKQMRVDESVLATVHYIEHGGKKIRRIRRLPRGRSPSVDQLKTVAKSDPDLWQQIQRVWGESYAASNIGRLATHLPGAAQSALRRQLFSNPRVTPHPLYPGGLRVAAEYLGLDPVAVAHRHTLFPLHLPFLSPDHAKKILDLMLDRSGVPHAVGVCAMGLPAPTRILVCAECMQQELKELGFAIIHRSHQVPGVLVCSHHNRVLAETSLLARAERGPGCLPVLNPSIRFRFGHAVPSDGAFLMLAKDVAELLSHPAPCPGPERLRNAYLAGLSKANFLDEFGRIRISSLIPAFMDHFSGQFLASIGPPLDIENRDNWLLRLLRRRKNAQHPVRHLVFWRFLGWSPQEALREAMSAPTFAPKRPTVRSWHNPSPQKLASKQALWLQALREGNGPIRKGHDALYSWLWRHCRAWLRRHKKANVRLVRQRRLDWGQWDLVLCKRLRSAARKLKRAEARAGRLRLARSVGKECWLVRDHPMLPRASRTITSLVESAEAYACRRITQAANTDPSLRLGKPWRLRVAAGVGAPLARKPAVKCLLAHLTSSSLR